MRAGITAAVVVLLTATPALAVNLTLVSEHNPEPGVTWRHYTTTSPSTHTWVALVDLCTDRIHVEATRHTGSFESTSSWAADEGVQLATNGDFYRSPLRVYGNAIGRGLPWPLAATGDDPGYSYEWFYEKYGWIAFGPDSVEFTHSEWVKNNASSFGGLSEGWMNGTVAPSPPAGTLALVSGFPELVIEGQPITCPSATDPSCFPDRTDMRSRHPRTAMGITADRQTFILAVVDGRTASSQGMYGLELTDLMAQLGAWEAFNLDGGGSSQMWVDGEGYVNDYSGNNNGGGARAMANHWGVFAGAAGGRPLRAGHCVSAAPCTLISPAGGTLDDQGPCFQAFGPDQWWRQESAGHGGHLYWTNAFQADQASNWAWWQLDFQQAGEYLLEYYAEPGYAIYDAAPHTVRAGGVDTVLAVDQSAGTGWVAIGSFTFDAGGDQWMALYDAVSGAVPGDQHITADAIRLTRLDGWCGDGTCDGDEGCDCPEDCAGPAEIPGNGIDDDCDGLVDEDDTPPDDDDVGPDDDDVGDDDAGDDDVGDDDVGDDDVGDDDDAGDDDSAGADDDGGLQPPTDPFEDVEGCGCEASLGPGERWWTALVIGLVLATRRRRLHPR